MKPQTVECPFCKQVFLVPSDQDIAIQKRGKCIGCLIIAGEPIDMEPYEFECNSKNLAGQRKNKATYYETKDEGKG
jgi:hypothetical protein